MRQPIIAGNWKMNKTPAEAEAFVRALLPELTQLTGVERVVCPPFLAIPAVAVTLKDTPVKVGAQNVHEKEKGAFTGSISVAMLKGLVEYVIVGHSEVREYQKETDEMINKKAKALLAGGLKPIIAVGESLAQRQANETDTFVGKQIRAAFDGIPASDVPTIVVAYEPIWAIGTGLSATGEQANATIQTAVRDVLTSLYGEDVAWKVRIQYGGSVNPQNMAEFMRQPQIDGALVGGASLEVESFVSLCRIAADVTAEVKGVR